MSFSGPLTAEPGNSQPPRIDSAVTDEIKRLEAIELKAFEDGDYSGALKVSEKLVALIAEHHGKKSDKYASVINDYATNLENLDRRDEALDLYKSSLELYRELLGDEHADTLTTLDNYTDLLVSLRRFEDAEPLLALSVRSKRKTLKEQDPAILAAIENHGSTLFELGRFREAEPVYEEALGRSRIIHGEKHPRTLRILTNYSSIIESLGRAGEAEPLAAEALRLRREIKGPKHPDTLLNLNNHALIVFRLGRYDEAARLFEESLDLNREVMGEKHRQTLVVMGNYATALEQMGEVKRAERLHAKVLRVRKAVLGAEHQETILAINNHALALQKIGRSDLALPLFEEALALRRKTLGGRHPDTLGGMINYAAILDEMAESEAAIPSHLEALALSRELLGEKHPTTLMSLNNYAHSLFLLGRMLQAEPFAREALGLRREVLGENHPDTLASLNNYASVLSGLGRWQEAKQPHAEAYRIAYEILNDTHPTALLSLNNYATVLDELGEYEEARKLHETAYDTLRRKLGREHPYTLRSMSNYALLLQNTGELDQAGKLFGDVLRLRKKVQGEQHPEIAVALTNYGWVLHELGRHEAAEAALEEAVQRNRDQFGSQHSMTFDMLGNLAVARLQTEGRAAFALEPAREIVSILQERNATAGFEAVEQAQLVRETDRQTAGSALFLEAAWFRGPGLESNDSSAAMAPLDSGTKKQLDTELFKVIQDAMAGSTSRAVARAGARKAAGRISSELEQLASRRQSLSDQWIAADKALVVALGESGEAVAAKRDSLSTARDAISAEIKSIDSRLRREAPDYFALVRPEALTLTQAQSLLKADEAALLLVPVPKGIHVVAVTGDGMRWHRADMEAENLANTVKSLRGALDQTLDPIFGEYQKSFDRQKAYSVYQKLIAPVERHLQGKSHLFIAASGILTSIPFSMLLSQPPEGTDNDPEALRKTPWLADRFALVHLPSLLSLKLLRDRRPVLPSNSGDAEIRPLDGFGDPVLAPLENDFTDEDRGYDQLFSTSRNADGSGLIDVSKLKSLPSLPGTAIELQKLRDGLNAPDNAIRLQAAATETAVRNADLSATRILAFATHGLLAGEVTGAAEPGLVFTPPEKPSEADDGFLTSSEITALTINADWVILSACNTASGNSEGAPGLSGLARSFFYAGAKNLLVSHWPVRDDVASLITVDTIAKQQESRLTRAQAFQGAMQNIRNDPDDDSKAHPAAWAPFILVGDK